MDNITCILGSETSPEIPEPVDIIFSCTVYHHIEDRPQYFAKLLSKLKKNGKLVIVDWKPDQPSKWCSS